MPSDRLATKETAIRRPATAAGRRSGDAAPATRQIAFTIAAIALGAKMAKADGIVTRDEVDAFKQVFHVPQDEMQNVGRIFDQARKSSLGFEAYAGQIAAHVPAPADGAGGAARRPVPHRQGRRAGEPETELDYLRVGGDDLRLRRRDFARIRAAHLGPDKTDPYDDPRRDAHDDANAEIKAAYRKLVRDTHPDRLIAKGMPKEFIDVATEKLAAHQCRL